MEVSEFAFSKFILFNEVQLSNAEEPINSTFEGTITGPVAEEQLLNAS